MLSRRDFLKSIGAVLGTTFLSWIVPRPLLPQTPTSKKPNKIIVVKGTNKNALMETACTAWGMQQLIKKRSAVVIKPNAAWSRTPEEAANVHPELLVSLINMCFSCGAGSVDVVEHTCDNYKSALRINGIEDAVKKTKARLSVLADKKDFVTINIPRGKTLKTVDVAQKILSADVYINMPIAKSHGSATLTLGMKNHMGAVENRWVFHTKGLHQCIADVSTVLRPHLIVVDATRVMLTKGPKGPGEVRKDNMLIVGNDQVAVDAYAATLFGYQGKDIGYIAQAYELGVGEIDLDKITVEELTV